MLKHTKGNLIDLAEAGEFNIIVHGCNCFETMGSGIAREIHDRYPAAFDADVEYSTAGDYNKLGNFSVMHDKFCIINAYTQYDYSRNRDVFEYLSFGMILQKLAHYYSTSNFGFPYIGMGLAGGDKERIITMLEVFAKRIAKTGGTATLVEFIK